MIKMEIVIKASFFSVSISVIFVISVKVIYQTINKEMLEKNLNQNRTNLLNLLVKRF